MILSPALWIWSAAPWERHVYSNRSRLFLQAP